MFSELGPYYGVDASQAWMMVPVGGANFILHNRGAKVKKYDDPRVYDFTDDFRKNPINGVGSLFKKFPLLSHSSWDQGTLISLLKKAPQDDNVRMLAISAKGVANFKFNLGADALEVWVAPKRYQTLAFRFVKYTGSESVSNLNSSNPRTSFSSGTHWDVTDAPKLVNILNEIYAPQGNIFFDSVNPARISVNEPFPKGVSVDFVQDKLLPQMDKDADYTVFFVEGFDGGRYGITGQAITANSKDDLRQHGQPSAGPSNYSIIPDTFSTRFAADEVKGDGFRLVFAHEVGHLLGMPGEKDGGHIDVPHLLASKTQEGLKINKLVMQRIQW